MKKPSGICFPCGVTANYLTCLRKYGQAPLRAAFEISTFHTGICGVCGHEAHVTEERDYFYPDFTLIAKVKKFLKSQNKKI